MLAWTPFGIHCPQGNTWELSAVTAEEYEFSHDSTHQTILIFSSPLLSGASSGREPKNSCLKLNAHFPLLAWCEHYLLPISFPSRLAYARKSHLDTVLQHPLLQGTSLCIVSPSQSFTFRLKKKKSTESSK